VARAPAAEAERRELSAERDRIEALGAVRTAEDELGDARAALARARSGHGDVNFEQTRVAYLERVRQLRVASVVTSARRVDVARARHEMAKATVADAHSVPEAVGLDLEAFLQEVALTESKVEAAEKDEQGLRTQVTILKKAVHTARVAKLKGGI